MHIGAPRCTAPRLFALVLCLPLLAAHAALANLVRQFVDAPASGKAELVCIYRYDGREFERRYPVGNFCPAYEEI
jgi:hypothetical protein